LIVLGDRPKPQFTFLGESGFTRKVLNAVPDAIKVSFFVGLIMTTAMYHKMAEETNR
jgi:hypothetical protein